ncbi:VOC family protein [Deinococcus sp. QL22]|uniref:VOC family protein n=1 Tax=Deinococcus sp. QL22 TaxID=2939437 RepID=UPI00353027F6
MDNAVHELRLVITTRDYERSKAFYQALLGTRALGAWESSEGRVIILEAGRATLEIVDENHAERIDEIEVGRRVSGDLRLALGLPDSGAAAALAQQVGGVLTNPVRQTP